MIDNFCVTFDEGKNLVSIGACIREESSNIFGGDTLFHRLPHSSRDLDEKMCRSMNRTGTLCGECLSNHYPLAYSYNMTCIPCPNIRWNWLKYIMAAYAPLTLFYTIIIFFKINTSSSYLFPAVFFCQTITFPVVVRGIFLEIKRDTNSAYFKAQEIIFSLYGIWNMDFFRPFYSELCLGIGILPTLALDYAVAVYPLILIALSYMLIVLYSKNYRTFTLICRPFLALSALFRRNWSIKTSVIDAFATFFYLSYTKLLAVTFDLLTPTTIYELHKDHYRQTTGVFYAASVEYFGKEHLPYAHLATFVLCLCVILPVLVLALYPYTFFQKFLNLFPFSWHILHTFVDSFYGCYQDGTQPGSRDYRWCASLFFVLRLSQILIYFIPNKMFYEMIVMIVCVLLVTLLAVLRPFKPSIRHYNAINIASLQLLVLLLITSNGICLAVMANPKLLHFFLTLGVIVCAVPLVYFASYSLYWAYSKRRFGLDILQYLRAYRSGYSALTEHGVSNLPHRIENPGEYHSKNLANFSQ